MNDAKQQAKFRDQDEQNTRSRAAILGLQYFDSRSLVENDRLPPALLSKQEMYQGHIVPLRDDGEDQPLVFGITSATPQSLLRDLRGRFQNRNVVFVMISGEGFRQLIARFDPPKEVTYDDVTIAAEGDSQTLGSVSETLASVRPDDILTYLIEQADRLSASDIHLECQRDNVRVRFRVDGALHSVAAIEHAKYRILQAAIASRANISTAAKTAQTGHMQQEISRKGQPAYVLNMRIETLPSVYGQDSVIRLFNFNEQLLKLENLGVSEAERRALEQVIEHPHGMLMVVGPTGSGKSTTLYSVLNALNQPSRKIITLEDPVEFSVPGIVQIPVSTQDGDSFAGKLSAVLRMDPDVIMIGEIRDVDTARTAIQASITGHLVLSTFHADTASAAFSRMIDLVGRNPVFISAIKMVIGQRLVRRLDDATKQEYQPDDQLKKWIAKSLEDLPEGVERPNLDEARLWRPGISQKSPFGYKGRVPLVEQLVVGPQMHSFLAADDSNLTTENIEREAKRQGMKTLLHDGILKSLQGVTSIEEVNRVI
ncbi:MAG: type II/IV secretion system protein [Candidatus Chaera renei]|uniref:Type II/IV secretion system protein n=1 Tax=Candidatus Chaera renei TaxID=2506947 RepID=A0A4Q0AIQ5_9BACT|nr:MAG: type II/IV secretion system protein [Candidatus Chaera renei]